MSTVLKGKNIIKRNCATAMKLDMFSHVQSLSSIKGQDLCWWHLASKKKISKISDARDCFDTLDDNNNIQTDPKRDL